MELSEVVFNLTLLSDFQITRWALPFGISRSQRGPCGQLSGVGQLAWQKGPWLSLCRSVQGRAAVRMLTAWRLCSVESCSRGYSSQFSANRVPSLLQACPWIILARDQLLCFHSPVRAIWLVWHRVWGGSRLLTCRGCPCRGLSLKSGWCVELKCHFFFPLGIIWSFFLR